MRARCNPAWWWLLRLRALAAAATPRDEVLGCCRVLQGVAGCCLLRGDHEAREGRDDERGREVGREEHEGRRAHQPTAEARALLPR